MKKNEMVPTFSQFLNEGKKMTKALASKIAKDFIKYAKDQWDVTDPDEFKEEVNDIQYEVTEFIYDNYGQKFGDSIYNVEGDESLLLLLTAFKKLGWDDPDYRDDPAYNKRY